MRVGLYLGRHASAASGMGVYCRALVVSLPGILASRPGDQVVIYGDRTILDAELINCLLQSNCSCAVTALTVGRGHDCCTAAGQKDKIEPQILLRLLPTVSRHQLGIITDQFLLPWYLHQDNLGMLHGLTNYGLCYLGCPQIITVHDLFQAFPDYLPNNERNMFGRLKLGLYRMLFAQQFKKVRKIITDTKIIAEEIQRRYHLADDCLTTVPLGLDQVMEYYLSLDSARRAELMRIWQKKNGLLSGYTLLFASGDPRKNTMRQVQAWSCLEAGYRDKGLVVIGAKDEIRMAIDRICQVGGPQPVHLAKITRQELPLVLDGAGVLLNVTHAEGFGLPAYEAAAMGCQIVTNRLESLEKLPQENLFYAESGDINNIVSSLKAAHIANAKISAHQQLRPDGGWRTMAMVAADTFDVYRQIVEHE